jgi:hypothetical protein
MATSQATSQAMWLPSIFGNIGILYMKPIVIYGDNRSYIFLSKNPVFHAFMKHIFIHHYLVQKKTKGGFVKLMYCNVENTIAAILTKELFINKHEYF